MVRILAILLFGLGCTGCAMAPTRSGDDWRLYKELFISAEGRVIDDGNANITHSEGQGIGMLLAVHNNDRSAFQNMWRWTRSNLQIRGDKLLAWKWSPDALGGHVSDLNNAADGDILVAWALARASKRWSDQAALRAAREISADIRAKLWLQSAHGLLLLPGEQGFLKSNGVTVNLSYWVFPALRDLEEVDPEPEWQQLTQTGLKLLRTARFGRWSLPPDWLWLSAEGRFDVAPGFNPRFGYDAVRIPLYLIWAKLDNAENLKPFNDFWSDVQDFPLVRAWTSLPEGDDSESAGTGVQAIASLARQRRSKDPEKRAVRLPKLGRGENYYSASLLLLAQMAALESAAR